MINIEETRTANQIPSGYFEVVYSAEMPGTKPPTHGERIVALEKALGFQKRLTVRGWIGEHWKALLGPFIAVISLIIGNFAWYQPRQVQLKQHADKDLAQQIDNQIEAKFRDHHFDDLVADVKTMKGQMAEISGFLKVIAEGQMKRVADLSSREFGNKLPEIKTILAVAGNQHVYAPEDAHSIAAKMSNVKISSPSFWGAASQLVSYRSNLETGFEVPSGLPNCFDTYDPKSHKMTQIWWSHVEDDAIGHCQLDLGDVDGYWKSGFGQELKKMEQQFGPPASFRLILNDTHIVYHGGEIIPAIAILCERCTFDFSVESTPPAPGKKLVQSLLTANLNKIDIDLPVSR